MVAVCPFHQEKTASLSIDPGRGLYYCFGCQAKGDVFTFVEETQGLSFNEAVEALARNAGITLTVDPGAAKRRGEHDELVAAVRSAVEFFHRRLKSAPDAGPARSYLRGRGYGQELVDQYHLGYSPDEQGWDALVRALRSSGHKDRTMEGAGLARRGRGGKLYDVFRGRLMFPINDLRGDPVGFGARILGEGTPKYINSAESRIYQKGRLLYGLDTARSLIARSGEAIVVEGYTDVIAFHQAGLGNAVATCGTALGEGHFDLLRRFADRIVLAFDADQAGAGAALRGDELETPVRLDLDLRVAEMPAGMDPADLLAAGRMEDLVSAVKGSRPLLQFRIDREAEAHDLSEPEARARAVRKLAPLVARVADDVARTEYIRYLARKLGVEVQTVAAAVGRRPAVAETTTTPPESADRRAQEDLLRVIIENPPELERAEIDPSWVTDEELAVLLPLLQALRAEVPAGTRLPIESVEADDQVRTRLLELAFDRRPLPADMLEPVERVRRRAAGAELATLREQLEAMEPGSEEHSDALRRLIALERMRRGGGGGDEA